ncbi:ATP-binding cassette domain-containing protein [uncultured Flavobacterium sp.]|uniref:ABC transporter ATP-binding protein n=1 Tax=uncultured Flavobacterium sp. TaxID=165435 RepID=UPI0030CA2276
MISTKHITFQYPNGELFHMPDIFCTAGNTLLITGNSGRGKTTYLHILAGILRPKSGEIEIDNTNTVALSERKNDFFRGKNIGIVFQKPYFIASLNVLENLEMTSWLANGNKNSITANKLLSELGLFEYASKLLSQLSVGQQQRFSIARALINKPKVLLADEPTSSLDDKNAETVIELLTTLSKEYKAALIIVTHDSRIKSKFHNQITMI